eukprot:gene6283-9630_t
MNATLYVSGLGFSDVEVNGHQLSNPQPMVTLGPWTAYDFQVAYSTYDVTPFLAAAGGMNNVTVLLGNGWRILKHLDPANNVADYTKRVFRLILAEASTKAPLLASDAVNYNWTTAASHITADDIYNGTTFDTRVTLQWEQVKANIPHENGPQGVMIPWEGPGVHVGREIAAVGITQPQTGVFVIDFGTNVAGVVRMNNVAKFASMIPAGQNITLRHAEILQYAGMPGHPVPGMIYTANLGLAKATDTFIFGGDFKETTWYPRLTYHGFRYLEVSGWGASSAGIEAGFKVDLEDFTLLHHHTSTKQTMAVNFTNALLNSMQKAAVGAQRSNMQTLVTDCDQRAGRLGWIGDLGLSCPSIAQNFDAQQHFRHLLNIMVSEMSANGSLPDVAPHDHNGYRPADVTWSMAFQVTVYESWKMYNDTSVISEYFDAMLANQANVVAQAKASGICSIPTPYGDWCPPPEIPGNETTQQHPSGEFVSLVSFILTTNYVIEMADSIKNTTVATNLRQQLTTLKEQLQGCFYYSNGTYDSDVQGVYDLVGAVDTMTQNGLPQGNMIKERLAALLKKWGNKNYAGITGFRYLYDYLYSVGMADIAQDVMLQTAYPSVGYMVVNTAEPVTENLWEIEDAYATGPSRGSRNHHMWSSYSSYLVSKMAGLDWRN